MRPQILLVQEYCAKNYVLPYASLASVTLLSTPLTAMAALRLFLGRLGLAQASNGAVKFMDLGANPFTVRLEI
jgi:hypothetical protein